MIYRKIIGAAFWTLFLYLAGPNFSSWNMLGAAAFGYLCALWFSKGEK